MAALLGVLAFLPLFFAPIGVPRSGENFVVRLGMAFGLAGFGLLTLQFLLSSRLKIVTYPIGLGQMIRWHRVTGLLALFILLWHPFLVSLGDHKLELLNPLRASWPVVCRPGGASFAHGPHRGCSVQAQTQDRLSDLVTDSQGRVSDLRARIYPQLVAGRRLKNASCASPVADTLVWDWSPVLPPAFSEASSVADVPVPGCEDDS